MSDSAEQLAARVAWLEDALRQLVDREREMDSLVLPDPFEGDPGDERMRNIEQQLAGLGQGRELHKPVLLPGGTGTSGTHFLAKITSGTYSAPRYRVIEQRISNTSGDVTTELIFEDKPDGYDGCATNLDEVTAESQDLPSDDTVYVIVFSGKGQEVDADTGQSQPITHYYFSGPAIVVD